MQLAACSYLTQRLAAVACWQQLGWLLGNHDCGTAQELPQADWHEVQTLM